ncbi:MAG: RES family NAD+ phosphorylase [Sedimenticola sp.]
MNLDECDHIFAQVHGESSPGAVCHAIQPLFDHYEIINIELGRGTVFWRGRFTGETPWATVDEMGYRPAEHTKPGRLNDENNPCLYAATRPETALLEIGAKENDLVQLVGFRAKLETPIRIAVIGELLHVHKTGYLRLTGSDPAKTMSRYLNSKGVERGRRLLYIDAFLSHLLADAEAKNAGYVRSRALASMVYRNADIDGIMFPSVQDLLGMNIALQPTPVDSKVHAVCCQHVRVTRVRAFGFIEYEVIGEAERTTSDGMFVWVKPLAPLRRRFFNLTKEEYETSVRSDNDPSAFMDVMSVYNQL